MKTKMEGVRARVLGECVGATPSHPPLPGLGSRTALQDRPKKRPQLGLLGAVQARHARA
jgi:hypothetical protein